MTEGRVGEPKVTREGVVPLVRYLCGHLLGVLLFCVGSE